MKKKTEKCKTHIEMECKYEGCTSYKKDATTYCCGACACDDASKQERKVVIEPFTVPELLDKARATFNEKSKEYGSSYKQHGDIMKALFPDGITLCDPEDFKRFGLLQSVIGKLHRYCKAFDKGFTHIDSIHDIGVYAFMLEATDREWIEKGGNK